tara:strand:+ start:688 stop:1446 length:759 start_codon:yes stop_codon:yes gene_type:complete
MQLGFLGSGRITSSIINGILSSKIRVKNIYISYRNKNISKQLSKKFKKVKVFKDNQEIINKSNIVFLAITPKVGHKILPKLKFQTNKKIISLISTIKLDTIKKYTKNKKVTRVIPLPFINMKKGPIIICPKDNKTKFFFSKLGTVIEVKKEKLSKGFWATSSFMASYYNLLNVTSNWLTSKGIRKSLAEKYTRELFLALSEDAMKKNKFSLKQLVLESQTPRGTNAYVLKELKKKKFYKLQQKVLNSIFKKF